MSDTSIKRVGIDAHMLGDHSGGNETYYKNILENMVVPEGMEIYVFVTRKADLSKLNEKIKVVYFGNHGATYRNLIELPMLCIKYKLDLLHVQYFIPFFRPFKTVVTIHDICFERIKDIFTRREYIRQKILIPYAAKKSDAIVTVSNFSKEEISEIYKIDPNKITVAPNATNDCFSKLSETIDYQNLSETYGIREDTKYILAVGNLQPRKNISRLLQAFSLYKAEFKDDIKLIIVGKKAWQYSDIFRTLEAGVEQGNLKVDDVLLTGYVEQRDLVQLYKHAIGFIYPSLYEGFGIPPLEAMACGTNVAISNIPSLIEATGNHGIIFDPYSVDDIKEAIKSLVSISNKKIGNEELEWARKHFSWAHSAKKIIKIYREI